MKNTFTLSLVAEKFNLLLECCDDPHLMISGVGTLQHAVPGQISFLENKSYQKYLSQTKASAVILTQENKLLINKLNLPNLPLLISEKPYLTYARIAALFNHRPDMPAGIHPTAVIGQACDIHPSAKIGAYCVIGDHCTIGAESCLFARVTLYDEVILGERVMIHSGAVIGSDGFGNAHDGKKWVKVPQLGRVVIGNDVEIGANTTIDRGALEDTVIEDGVRLDNQIQIAHNVRIGAHTAIAACTGIAGSTHIGKHCMIGGAVGINGHIEICDGVMITAMSGVIKSIRQPGVYSSTPFLQKNLDWRKTGARLRHLDELFDRVAALEKNREEEKT